MLLAMLIIPQAAAQEFMESPHLKVIMEFKNTDESIPRFKHGDVIEVVGYVEENHGLTKVGNVSINFFLSGLDGDKFIVEDILTDENGNFSVSISLKNPTIGKYFLTAEPTGLGYQNQLDSQKQTLEFFLVPHSLSPLKQFNTGIPIDEIKCKENLLLVIKSSNGNPACVTTNTKDKLMERGWAINPDKDRISSQLCSLIPDPGPCKAAFTKYYFDTETNTCQMFTWGGCDGIVPFDTIERCKYLCS